jgi:hypothetical protein
MPIAIGTKRTFDREMLYGPVPYNLGPTFLRIKNYFDKELYDKCPGGTEEWTLTQEKNLQVRTVQSNVGGNVLEERLVKEFNELGIDWQAFYSTSYNKLQDDTVMSLQKVFQVLIEEEQAHV